MLTKSTAYILSEMLYTLAFLVGIVGLLGMAVCGFSFIVFPSGLICLLLKVSTLLAASFTIFFGIAVWFEYYLYKRGI